MVNFQSDVLEASFDKPVVVDFWAPWCGPCRVLGPVIEQIAEEQSDQWTLVKLNTEEEQEVAMAYQIRSIPNVKMFHKGEVIAEFMGALPRQQILKWLDDHLPDERKAGLDHLIQQASQTGNVEALSEFVQNNPDITEAKIALAKLQLWDNPATAYALIEDIKMGHPLFDEVEPIQVLAHFMNAAQENNGAGENLVAAQTAFSQKNYEMAIQQIIDAVKLDKTYADDLPRKLAIAFFNLRGPKDELVKAYRWRFDMALY